MKFLVLFAFLTCFSACSETAKNNSQSDAGNSDSGETNNTPFKECEAGFYEISSSVDSDDPENPGGKTRSCKEIPSSCAQLNANNGTNNGTTSTNNGTTNSSTNNAQNNLQDGTTQYCRCLIDNTPGSRDYCECNSDGSLVSCFTSG